MKTKHCPSCGLEKPLEAFSKNRKTKDGLAVYCRMCYSEKCKKSHAKVKADPLAYAEYLAKERDRHLKRTFGISSADYDAMLRAQGGRCAICRDTSCKSGVAFAVDHCHATGKIRGLLCRDCNTSLGKFNDDIETLQRAIQYLRAAAEG